MYSIDGLTHGIERCKINIQTLEDAIKAERQTIADYRSMIATLEKEKLKQEEAEANVHIEVVHDSSD